MTGHTYIFDTALIAGGWAHDVMVRTNAAGMITEVTAGKPVTSARNRGERVKGIAIPGMPNAHSHAFQRGFAGLAEARAGGRQAPRDDFWSWRQAMYRFAGALTPETLEAITAQAYLEMLKAGYTSVAEFHYLHNGADGAPYADPAEMSRAVVRAADGAGIGLTLLPVLYQTSGFCRNVEDLPPEGVQKRFFSETDHFIDLIEALIVRFDEFMPENGARTLGFAFHSLRAVPRTSFIEVLKLCDVTLPVHIHVAEQRKEVVDCMGFYGLRPVHWLLEHGEIDRRWCLVHATHLDDTERRELAVSRAVAGLCPTTEASLGDGIFPLPEFLTEGGQFAIGSDSHISLDPREELRLLEYGQRLTRERRNLLADDEQPHVGANLYARALAGGARALSQPVGAIEKGRRADIVVLDADHPALAERDGDNILDSHVFVGGPTAVSDVMTSGRWVVRGGQHAREEEILAKYREAVRTITATQ